MNLQRILGRENNVAACLYAEVTVPKAVDVTLKLGYEQGCVAYLNGKKIHSRAGARFRIDERRVNARLNAGANKLLLKVLTQTRGWSACVRLVCRKGELIEFAQPQK